MRRRFTSTQGIEDTFDFNNYLTMEALEDGFSITFSNEVEYGIDEVGWKKLKIGDSTPSIDMGHTISFRGNLIPQSAIGVGRFVINKSCNLLGNVMSILFGDRANSIESLSGYTNAFQNLFYNCSGIRNISDDFLPATTLANNCYYEMFRACSNLTTAPALPATTLANYCYYGMFHECKSLTTAPELPSTIMADYCYCNMFQGCSNLTTAHALPATTLADYCYSQMFRGCSSLTTIHELPATTLADRCYRYMFYGCSSLTTAPALPATTMADGCYEGMFSGCADLTTAPALPATTLAEHCYNGMFRNCNKLNYIIMLATDISAYYCLYEWVSYVSSTGTFVKNPNMTSLPTGDSGIPSGWTVINNS